uniref:Immunoglobulin V-set domain-containing protein n=1 Tax=Callorhinchus milii TaxID=7868 RepID=A0A4W3HAS3_CALMI
MIPLCVCVCNPLITSFQPRFPVGAISLPRTVTAREGETVSLNCHQKDTAYQTMLWYLQPHQGGLTLIGYGYAQRITDASVSLSLNLEPILGPAVPSSYPGVGCSFTKTPPLLPSSTSHHWGEVRSTSDVVQTLFCQSFIPET